MNDKRVADSGPRIEGAETTGAHAHHGHGWMMMVCCIPMLVVAVALVATGTASATALLGAVACAGMMVLMMRGMDHAGKA